jgi:hypothetical protein
MIHVGYYNALSPNSANPANDRYDHQDTRKHDLAHVRHCLDYLRQSIMCAADSNLEPVNDNLGGVTGWGSPRVCRRYDELVEWSTRWKNGSQIESV